MNDVEALRARARFFRPNFDEILKASSEFLNETGRATMKGRKHYLACLGWQVCRNFAYSIPEIREGAKISNQANIEELDDLKGDALLVTARVLARNRHVLEHRERVRIAMEMLGVVGDNSYTLYHDILERACR